MRGTRLVVAISSIALLGFLALFFRPAAVIERLPWFYLAALVVLLYGVYDNRDLVIAFFRPSSVMVFYVCVFFFMGTLAFRNEQVLLDFAEQYRYYSMEDIPLASLYFFLAMSATLASRLLPKRWVLGEGWAFRIQTQIPLRLSSRRQDRYFLSISIGVAVLSSLMDIGLAGGVGSFSSVFYLFATIHITYHSVLYLRRVRYLVYALVTFVLLIVFYSDRRLLFYYAFIVVFIEAIPKIRHRVRIGRILVLVVAGFLLVFMNLGMSIQRGVGSFEADTVIQSMTYVNDYLQSDWARTMLFHNFEGPATTFHSYRAASHVIAGGDLSYGTTFLKFFFLPIPRRLFPAKPDSMVDQYTTIFYPEFRKVGGSFVPNFYAEAIWNFGFAGGLVWLIFIFYLLDALFLYLVSRLRYRPGFHNVLFLSSFAFLLFLFRGSGFDLYGLFVLIFVAMSSAYRAIIVDVPGLPWSYVTRLPRDGSFMQGPTV